MANDETAAAEADYQAIQRAIEDLRPQYEASLSTKPLTDFDPIPTLSAEGIRLNQQWQELQAEADKARTRLDALRDS